MDFSNRVSQPQQTASSASQFGEGSTGTNKNRAKSKESKLASWGTYALSAVVVLLIVAVVIVLGFGGPKAESSYIDTNKLQAVFLNTGQVYFGNIKSLNSNYLVLGNIYYLQTSNSGTSSTSNSNQNVSLVKLGCELHAPYDQMVVNRSQVTFWENLQSSGQVAKAVAQFQKDNPQGQKCSDQSQAGSSSSNGVQGSSTPTPTTTPTPSATTPSSSTTTTRP